ncbi:ParB/RepB/Spo0J family partition protein [Streptomyces sp. NPDC048481]|uniref:ParB/RepB/Spo0J family partition protein n=1 Tax=Streptomyces sp. NPDC048481 TaxID=3365557 RepID=UPI003718CFE7
MSKADQLGAGRFGAAATRTVSARRQAVAAATGVPTEGIAPPSELPVHRISVNPDNPRSSLGDLTDLAGSLTTHGQKVAITVMNRDAYIRVNPDKEADLEPDTTHVVIDGSSRLSAAREAGLATIKVMVSDDQGSTSEELLESALVANIHRQDLEEIDEARALQRLLTIHGSQRALAKRLHRSQGWVSQRLALLHLTPELQERIGEEPIDLLRAVGNKPAQEQEAALEDLKAERARREEAKARTLKPGSAQSGERPDAEPHDAQGSDYGVITGGSVPDFADEAEAEPAAADHAAIGTSKVTDDASHGPSSASQQSPSSPPFQPSVPAQGPTAEGTAGPTAGEQKPKRFPYEDGVYAAQHLIYKMPPEEFNKMLDLLIKHRDTQGVSAT